MICFILVFFWPLGPHGKSCNSATDNESASLRKLPFVPTILLYQFPAVCDHEGRWHISLISQSSPKEWGAICPESVCTHGSIICAEKVFIDSSSTKWPLFMPFGETAHAHIKRQKNLKDASWMHLLLLFTLALSLFIFFFISASEINFR